jgi:hypothetical protein
MKMPTTEEQCDLTTIRNHLFYWIRVRIRNPGVSICKMYWYGTPYCDNARKVRSSRVIRASSGCQC